MSPHRLKALRAIRDTGQPGDVPSRVIQNMLEAKEAGRHRDGSWFLTPTGWAIIRREKALQIERNKRHANKVKNHRPAVAEGARETGKAIRERAVQLGWFDPAKYRQPGAST